MAERQGNYHRPFLTEDQLKQKLERLGCKLLSPYSEYKGLKGKIRYIASCGHENCITLSQLGVGGRGIRCPKCSLKHRDRLRHGHIGERIYALAEQHHCRVIAPDKEDVMGGGKIEFIPACGHGTRTVLVANFVHACKYHGDPLCLECTHEKHNKKVQFSEEQVAEILNERGCTYIPGSYKDSASLVSFIAKCGHPDREIFSHVRRKSFSGECKACSRSRAAAAILGRGKSRFAALCKKYGCELLEYYSAQKGGLIRGSCGHEFEITPAHLEDRQSGVCYVCSGNASEICVYKRLSEVFGEENVVRQYRIHTKRPYQYIDVAVPRAHLCVEYNGPQHYEFFPRIHETEHKFLVQLNRDARKRAWCKKNGFYLVEIDGRTYKANRSKRNMTKEVIVGLIEKQTGKSISFFTNQLTQAN